MLSTNLRFVLFKSASPLRPARGRPICQLLLSSSQDVHAGVTVPLSALTVIVPAGAGFVVSSYT